MDISLLLCYFSCCMLPGVSLLINTGTLYQNVYFQKHVTLSKLHKIGQYILSVYRDHCVFLFPCYEQLTKPLSLFSALFNAIEPERFKRLLLW